MRAERNLPHGILEALLAVMLCLGAASQAVANELYRSQTLITGQGEPNRLIGFATCLEQVLIKVSGAVSLTGDARLEPYKAAARDLVRAYEYIDEKGGKPKNDEQGTRDRSFFLIVDFDETRVNDTLAALGLKPWLAQRPVLTLFVEMNPGARTYVVASDSPETDLQRASLHNAADRRGMQIVLPKSSSVAGLPPGGVAVRAAPLALLSADQADLAVVVARLAWDDQALKWNNAWRLDWNGRRFDWQFAAETFDEAYRRGIGNAAEALAGAAAGKLQQPN